MDWNIDRGLKLPAIIDFLADTNADVFLLQEVDINAHRTHRLNIAREIARKLRLNYVFGARVCGTDARHENQPRLSWSGHAFALENLESARDPLSAAIGLLGAAMV